VLCQRDARCVTGTTSAAVSTWLMKVSRVGSGDPMVGGQRMVDETASRTALRFVRVETVSL